MAQVEIWVLAAPPAAGKSTLAGALAATVARAGVPARVLELDEFYRGEARAARRAAWEAFHGAALAAAAEFRAAAPLPSALHGRPARGGPAGVVLLTGCYHKRSLRDILESRATAANVVVRWLLPHELLAEGAAGRARLALRCFHDADPAAPQILAEGGPRQEPPGVDPLARPHIALWMSEGFDAARLGRCGPIAAGGRRHLWRVLEPADCAAAVPIGPAADPFALLAAAEAHPGPPTRALAALAVDRADAIAAALPARRPMARQLSDLAASGLFSDAGIVRASPPI